MVQVQKFHNAVCVSTRFSNFSEKLTNDILQKWNNKLALIWLPCRRSQPDARGNYTPLPVCPWLKDEPRDVAKTCIFTDSCRFCYCFQIRIHRFHSGFHFRRTDLPSGWQVGPCSGVIWGVEGGHGFVAVDVVQNLVSIKLIKGSWCSKILKNCLQNIAHERITSEA